MNKKIFASLIFLSFFAFSFIVLANENEGHPFEVINEKDVWENVKTENPAFTNIVTTVYHTASLDDYDNWYEGNYDDELVSTSLGYCVVPERKRGFYEDVRCSGSGVDGDNLYRFNTIKKTKDASPIEGTNTRGITSEGNEPIPKWTVAINTDETHDCYIPYGTLMYIRFEPNHPWNGVYKADDTGSAFTGECKLDIYAGVGLKSIEKAVSEGASGKTPRIYFLDDEYNYVPANELEVKGSHGSMGSKYSSGNIGNFYGQLINYAQDFSKRLSNSGMNNLENIVSDADEDGYKISSICPMSGLSYSTASNEIIKDNLHSDSNLFFLGVVKEIIEIDNERFAIAKSAKGDEFLVRNISANIQKGTSFEISLSDSPQTSNLARFSKSNEEVSLVGVDEDFENLNVRGPETLLPIFDLNLDHVGFKTSEVAAKTILGKLSSEFASCSSSASLNCDCDIETTVPWDKVVVNNGVIAISNLGYSVETNLNISNKSNADIFEFDNQDLVNVTFDGNSLKLGNNESLGTACQPEFNYSLHCIARNYDIPDPQSKVALSYFNSNVNFLTFNFAVASKR